MNTQVRNRLYTFRIPSIFPSWLTRNAFTMYFLALMVVSVLYSAYSIPWYFMLSGVVSVFVFFIYGSTLTKQTMIDRIRKESVFEKRIFLTAFIPRILLMALLYWVYMSNYGSPFAADDADVHYYDELGQFVSELISKGNFHFYDEIVRWTGGRDDISDMGYGIYVGLIYSITGNSIIAVRLLKCVWSSLTVLLIYRLARRNFDPQTARLAAIFCALWPNFWYYCGTHLKESEMVFLTVLFVEQAEQMLRL